MSDLHPDTLAWREFKRSNRKLFETHTLGTKEPDKYLENRLWTAFSNGLTAARKQQKAVDSI